MAEIPASRVYLIPSAKLQEGDTLLRLVGKGVEIDGVIKNIRELKTLRVVTLDNGKVHRYGRNVTQVRVLHDRAM